MKPYWTKKENNGSLLLIFNGWGCDENIIQGIDISEYDILILSDYTELDIDLKSLTAPYSVIKVIAWSFGVYVANLYLQELPRVVYALAVNGTIHPIDDNVGIPSSLFQATLDHYDERFRVKFFRRMMGGNKRLEELAQLLPQRSTEEQRIELFEYQQRVEKAQNTICYKWDKIVIGNNDLIFPPSNLINAWKRFDYDCVEAAHFIPFQKLINQYL